MFQQFVQILAHIKSTQNTIINLKHFSKIKKLLKIKHFKYYNNYIEIKTLLRNFEKIKKTVKFKNFLRKIEKNKLQ